FGNGSEIFADQIAILERELRVGLEAHAAGRAGRWERGVGGVASRGRHRAAPAGAIRAFAVATAAGLFAGQFHVRTVKTHFLAIETVALAAFATAATAHCGKDLP